MLKKASYSNSQLKEAVRIVTQEGRSIAESATLNRIPRSTLGQI